MGFRDYLILTFAVLVAAAWIIHRTVKLFEANKPHAPANYDRALREARSRRAARRGR